MTALGARQGAALLALLAGTAVCRAEPLSPDTGNAAETERTLAARTAFERGRALLEVGHPEEACAAFAESHALQPTVAALLNLGLCHQRSARLATALTFFREAEAAAAANGDAERAAAAARDAAEVRARVGTLTFHAAAPVSNDVEIWLDGTRVPRPAWSSATPLDAGDHRVEIRSRDRIVQLVQLTIADGVPATYEVQHPPPPLAPPPKRHVPTRTVSSAPATTLQIPAASYVAGGVGLASLGVGLAFGFIAWGKYATAEAECPSHRCPVPHARDLYDSAERNASVANVAVGIGAASLLTGFVIYFARGHGEERRPGVSLVTTPVRGGGAGALRGEF